MEFTDAYARTADWVEGLIRGVQKDQLTDPTPCAKWTVHDLLNHVIGGSHFFGVVMNRETPPDVSDMPDLVGDDPAGAYRAGVAGFQEATSREGALEGEVTAPFGTVPAGVFVGIAFVDHLAHGWDLAKATGQDTTIPADLVDVAEPFARQAFAGIPRDGEVLAAEVDVPESAPAQDRLMGFLGRQP